MLFMIASLMLFIAVMFMISRAGRLKAQPKLRLVPRTMTGAIKPMMHPAPFIHTQVNLPQLQMVVLPSEEDSKLISDSEGYAQSSELGTSCRMSAMQLLYDWSDAFLNLPAPPKAQENSPLTNPLYKELVFRNMRKVISDASLGLASRKVDKVVAARDRRPLIEAEHLFSKGRVLEMVGLIPKREYVESGSDCVSHVRALGVLSSEKLEDDLKGSLRKTIEEQYGKPRPSVEFQQTRQERWGRRNTEYDVLAIEGLVELPGCPTGRVLLSKIEKYALKEHKLIVVPERAYITRDKGNLTEYYMALGFEKVQMQRGPDVLVYMGTSSSSSAEDGWHEIMQCDHAMMVGMNF